MQKNSYQHVAEQVVILIDENNFDSVFNFSLNLVLFNKYLWEKLEWKMKIRFWNIYMIKDTFVIMIKF